VGHDYKIVINGKTFFEGRPSWRQALEIDVQWQKQRRQQQWVPPSLLASLRKCDKPPGKGRQSPPAAFQRTINQQAFGGEILEVRREDKRPWQVE
jgi:hypothetical protein